MKGLLIGFLLLGSVSAFADISLRKEDTFSVRTKKDITLQRNTTKTRLGDYGCYVETTDERFDRFIKAERVYTFKINNLNLASNIVWTSNINNSSALRTLTLSLDYYTEMTLNNLKDQIKKLCGDSIELINYTPQGHEGAVEVE